MDIESNMLTYLSTHFLRVHVTDRLDIQGYDLEIAMKYLLYSLNMVALWACQATSPETQESETNDSAIEDSNTQEEDTGIGDTTVPNDGDVSIPLFIVAGQSNAEGNVRLTGLTALQEALPSHNDPLSTTERNALREAYRIGIGDWCNPDEDYSDEMADAAIDSFRDLSLDISAVSASYTIDGGQMIAHRWFHQDASESLGEPYENPDPNAHLAHLNQLAPMSVGFGLWDSEETEVLFYGPELGFALRMHQNEALTNFYMMKVAMGGSSLIEHWAPEGPMRQKLYEKTDAFLAENDAYVAGFIWFQGYNDQFEESHRIAYKDNLSQLVSDFRATYGLHLPVVVIQARKVHDLTIIADAQATFVAETENTVLVESDGITNCFHYDSVSQLVIGDRTANAILPLLSE